MCQTDAYLSLSHAEGFLQRPVVGINAFSQPFKFVSLKKSFHGLNKVSHVWVVK